MRPLSYGREVLATSTSARADLPRRPAGPDVAVTAGDAKWLLTTVVTFTAQLSRLRTVSGDGNLNPRTSS